MKLSELPTVTSSRDIQDLALAYWKDLDYSESFVVFLLNNSNRVLGARTIATGGITSVLVDVRILFSIALKGLATQIICVHNHPSGSLTPSDGDIQITKKIRDMGIVHKIRLLDHLILTSNGYYSFADNGGI